MAIRFFILTSFFFLLYGMLGLKLYQLQVEKGEYYFKKVEARQEALAELSLRRGQILFTDRNGKDIPVALNRDYPIIYAVPKEITDFEKTVRTLAPALNVEEKEFDALARNPQSLFRIVAEKVSPQTVSTILGFKLDGIYSAQKQYRFYPFGAFAAHLLGFVGINDAHEEPIGLYGAEKFYDKRLARGDDVKLSIDRNLQVSAEETLAKLVSDFEGTGGTVIVQNPSDGSIVALANYPAFDPNDYKESAVKNFLNPAIQYVYEPGSVFKPFTMAAGIDSGAFTPETTFIDTGSVTLNGKTIMNWDEKAHGKVTMTNVIEQSINTGAVFAEKQVGHKRFHAYLKSFGFGGKTGIGLPDEVAGSLKNLERKGARDIDFATASFGQGTAVTPIQLATAFSAIANGGILMRPFISGEEKPYVVGRVIKEETARAVTGMMESAVEKAKVAAIPNYRVAGKTGTAQIPNFKTGGYEDAFIHTYVGFAPASNPKFVILIKLDRPNAPLAGITVVPAFRELAQFILNYYNVPPDRL